MNGSTIAFVGGGNMAGSLVGGLLARGWSAEDIRVSDPQEDSRARLAALGVHTTADNTEAVAGAAIVVLAVKPQIMRAACLGIREAVAASKPLVISIAAGTSTDSMAAWLGESTAIVRCMPNTPAMLQCGASVLYATPQVGIEQRRIAHEVLESVGYAAWVDREELLHAVTALSGSGPAYVFLMLEAMQRAGENLGLEPGLARRLASQTALGAARMAQEGEVDVVELRRRVTSPGGTTERAIRVFEQSGFRAMFEAAMGAACDRSRELAAAGAGTGPSRVRSPGAAAPAPGDNCSARSS
jgi:pyrroline-5-carboxylate reductase